MTRQMADSPRCTVDSPLDRVLWPLYTVRRRVVRLLMMPVGVITADWMRGYFWGFVTGLCTTLLFSIFLGLVAWLLVGD